MSNHSCSNCFTFWICRLTEIHFWGPGTSNWWIHHKCCNFGSSHLPSLEFNSSKRKVVTHQLLAEVVRDLSNKQSWKWKMVILGGWAVLSLSLFFGGGRRGIVATNWVSPCNYLFIFCWMFVLDQSVHEPVIFFIIIQAFSWPKPLAKKIPELERENDKTI